MLYDKLDDPGAALSFAGHFMRPETVADVAVGLLDRPRALVTIPRRRAVFIRFADLFPGFATACCRSSSPTRGESSGAGSGESSADAVPERRLGASGRVDAQRRAGGEGDQRAQRAQRPIATAKAGVVPEPSTSGPATAVPIASPSP